jgi:hypothetical protein
MQDKPGNNEVQNDVNQWGQAILRAKTTLIKPYSKVRENKNEFWNSFLCIF